MVAHSQAEHPQANAQRPRHGDKPYSMDDLETPQRVRARQQPAVYTLPKRQHPNWSRNVG
jgi:hypothetical protein